MTPVDYPLDASRPLGALRLDGRIAVITGAASGIGRGIAQMFAAVGARVVLSDRNAQGLAETARAIGAAAVAHVAELGTKDAAERLAAFAETIGPIDIWVNGAGIGSANAVSEGNEEAYRRTIAINQDAVFWGCSAAARRMEPRGSGSIINISSIAADKGDRKLAAYSMSKAAVNALTRVLANEVGPAGVRVNAVAPGFIVTEMTVPSDLSAAEREARIAQSVKRAPLPIAGYPEDVAHAALYLASDAGRYVTGQVIRVNGGATMIP